ncbi:MAG: hypothetical protein HC915_09195 [Anaerolineae bacterium]|nr:hypothetical protein [Anaerolineae bacterium]
MSLRVDQQPYLALSWQSGAAVDEPRLIRALSDWLGVQGRLAETAFRAGEVLRRASRFPAHRRVEVFNHKQILAIDATADQPRYAVDQLTRAVFGVLRWYQIARLEGATLQAPGGPFAGAHLTLREAYRTVLDLRLSTGRPVQDYPQPDVPSA